MAITRSPLVLKMGLGNDFIPQRVCATGTTVAPGTPFRLCLPCPFLTGVLQPPK